jgi:hypothetical protein
LIYRQAPFFYSDHEVIAPGSGEAFDTIAVTLNSPASGTWVANLAVFVPFGVSRPFLVREMWWFNGSTAGGNIDVGLYDTAGNRLASLGSTAQGAASSIITSSTFTDYTLAPGDYYMAFAASATTAAVGFYSAAANISAGFGVGQMTTALPLPNPATIVPLTNAMVPYFGLNGNTVAM